MRMNKGLINALNCPAIDYKEGRKKVYPFMMGLSECETEELVVAWSGCLCVLHLSTAVGL
jgi:hypothetical protein